MALYAGCDDISSAVLAIFILSYAVMLMVELMSEAFITCRGYAVPELVTNSKSHIIHFR
jgi:hypothetical protein